VAVNAARDAGVDAVVRLSGGRPVAFHEGTIGISWTLPDPDGRRHIGERFEMASSLCCEALRALGVDARIGAVSGEYCPGRYSVSAAGVTKLAGLGQRIVRGGVHLGGVVVVSDEQRARSMLAAVYEPLGIGWDPATVGSIAGALGAPIALEAVEEAIGAALEARFGLAVPTG
jgi:lipoate-protein ligase A